MQRPSSLIICVALFGGVLSMSAQNKSLASTHRGDERPFALVFDGTPVSYNGTGADSERTLKQYVVAHPGRYLLFQDRGSLYRLDDQTSVAAAEHQLAAMRPLEAREKALGAEQTSFGQQLRELSKQMSSAQTAEQRSSIGGQMSTLGDRMGKLGDEQGHIGNQIGAIANAFYQSAQALFTKCLADASCRRV